MPHWDVFHGDRLQAERSLTTEAVREALALGDLNEDDLVRPAGESRWTRIGQSLEFAGLATRAEPPAPIGPGPSRGGEGEVRDGDLAEFEIEPDAPPGLDRKPVARQERGPSPGAEPPRAPGDGPTADSRPVLPDGEAEVPDLPELVDEAEFAVIVEEDDGAGDGPELEHDPQREDDEAAEFTLSRNSAETVEELDLAAMVDVAFQLVLFFLVTAQVVLFKTLEIPRPNEDKPPDAAVQGRSQSVDELEKDYILVEVDAAGAIKVDRQPVAASRPALVERLRKSREDTARKALLLSADFATRHENAVLVFDVANEIDLRIAIAQPASKK